MSPTPFLFATGIENSYPTIAGGVRIDQMEKCGHYARWEEEFALVRESGLALIDAALPEDEQKQVADALAAFQAKGILFHAIRTRVAGPRRFVSMHVLVPGAWTVQQGHELCESIEAAVRDVLPRTTVLTHLEPREDPVSWEDRGLDR